MSIGWPGSWTKKGDVRSESLRCSSLEAPSRVKVLRNVTRAGLPHKFTRTTQAQGLHSDSKSLVTPSNIPGGLLFTQKHSQLIASTLAKESVVCHSSSASRPESRDSQIQGVLSSGRRSTDNAGAKLERLSSSRLSLQIIAPECHQQRPALKVHLAVHHHFPNHPISCKRRDRVSDNFNNLG